MKKQILTLLTTLILILSFSHALKAQEEITSEKVELVERNLGGPRVGLTYMFLNTESQQKLKDKGIGNLISQFGWHFEYQVIPKGGGPQFIIEFIPLVAGVEYGTFIPSTTLGIGVRFPSGIEVGVGPNLLVTDEGVKSALMIGIGQNFSYGSVNLPVNLVVVTSPRGTRVSLIFGYAI